ncbi:LysR family transcriptional regulator [Bradyrhizobium sp. Gha]|uniref:LysR family transcriptional regulator n=1 Tax=Bradyrhizobium sp. Gha TaxID=1855318 RepID=UPI0008E08DDD|nr:LysR family transcriptional regulator [Bradyrhizobium sp. Gha]SFJ68962.1 DNA-binding transcriptional regulator, LysR family [Bradyrhizobium sp. Gha]
MQDLDWNDLRYILLVARSGRIAGAARELGVDETTVARRIARLERLLGVRLFERHAGNLTPTDSGQIVITQAERIELDVEAIKESVRDADRVEVGKVRVTAVPLVLNHILIPALPGFLQLHPRLQIELVADPRNLSVTNREADIALRLTRPESEHRVVARRVGTFEYAVYAASAGHHDLPWITYDAIWSNLPHALWMTEAIASDPKSETFVTVNDSELALTAVRAGLGRSLLPCRIADNFPELSRLSGATPILSREMWLMVHPDLKHLARVRAVISWIERLMSAGCT